MPGRLTPLVNGEFYHLFNRGIDKRHIFLQQRDFKRFKQTFIYYQLIGNKIKFSNFAKSELNLILPSQENKLIDIICYCLMPNHFHFLVRQLKDNGISIFISQLCNSYTKYFNTKYKRVGPILEGSFKAVRVESNDQLIHLSRYIHLNPVVSGLVGKLGEYPWSSYEEYMQNNSNLCLAGEILNFFSSKEKYRQFLEDQIEYGISLEMIKHQLIEDV